ncbi:MAG TPA: hypothetical protein VFN67_21610 [Polyangiales bacterium]|nr:hypothetical protein [Polyangiales bacterium]
MWNSMLLRRVSCATVLGMQLVLVDMTQAQAEPAHYARFSAHLGSALHETDDNFAFALAPNDDVIAIKKSDTGSDSTEVHVLSAASRYQQFSLQTGTPLAETGPDFDFVVSGSRDLYAIKKSGTASGTTELHVLSAKSQYQEFILHTATALKETDDDYEFEIAPNDDLIVIKKNGTGSESTEVHVLSAVSGYREFSLQTGTALHETDDTFTFVLARNRDLVALKMNDTGSHSTEVHVLSAADNYASFSLQTGTDLQETDDSYGFLMAQNRDLVVLKKQDTGTNSTEVHVLTY